MSHRMTIRSERSDPLKVFGLICAVTLSLTPLVHTQSTVETWTFADFQSAVIRIKLAGNIDTTESAALDDISTSLNGLRGRYTQAYGQDADDPQYLPHHLSKPYYQSMAADLFSLRSLPSDHAAQMQAIEDVRKDLSTKANFVSSSLGVTGSSFPSVITVTVDTVDATGKRVYGLWVRCNPERWGVTSHPLFVFNSATTPTSSILPPGYFVLWIEDSHKKVLEVQPIELGAAGHDTERISFSLP